MAVGIRGLNSAILGADTLEIEKKVASYVRASYGVLIEKAGDGLSLALAASGVGDGTKVLCTALGNAAAVKSIEALGAKPVFVDINPNTLNIDPFCLEYVVKKCRREKADVPIALVTADLFGQPCNYTEITELCERYGISLIEDMGGAFGAALSGRMAGSFGRFAVASFFGANAFEDGRCFGDEGIVLCRTKADSERVRQMRGEGSVQQELEGEWGGEAAGIMVSEMLKRLDGELLRRRNIAGWYKNILKGKVRVQEAGSGCESAYTQFVIILDDAEKRAAVMDRLSGERIPCAVYYPNALTWSSKTTQKLILTNAERISQRLLALPMHPYLSKNVVGYICGCVLSEG